MPIWIGVVFFILTLFCFISWFFLQTVIVSRLKEINNGVEHPLVSKNGIDVNVHNSDFNDFLNEIDEEKDSKLRLLKIWHKRMFRFGILMFCISLIVAFQIEPN